MVVAAVYLFVSCYTAGLSLEAVNDNTEVGLSNNTRLLQSPSYDPFFQRRIKKQQAESNITLGVGGRLFQSEWNEEGSCFLYFIIIFLAFFIILGLFTFIICYSYGWNKLLYVMVTNKYTLKDTIKLIDWPPCYWCNLYLNGEILKSINNLCSS